MAAYADTAAASLPAPTDKPAVQAAKAKKPLVRKTAVQRTPKVTKEKAAKRPEAGMPTEIAPAAPKAAPASEPADPVLQVSAPVTPPTALPGPAHAQGYTPRPNPYLVNPYQPAPSAAQAAAPTAQAGSGARLGLPQLSLSEQSILPRIQTVYPTGEKPLVVVTFKCPTELVGIDTPSTLILHKVVNGSMDLINKTNLLSFNMQQVCQ